MAEGLLGGFLGGDEEKPDAESPGNQLAAEAFAAAVAAKLAGNDPQVARDTSAFLREQTQLLKVQKEVLEDEHALRVANLEWQEKESDLRRTGIRIRIAFQLFAALVAAFIGLGLVFMVQDAFTSRQVVVHPFEVPPGMISQGLSGKVVATGVLDELSRLQNATRADAAKRHLSNAWSNEIKLDVPETGLSLGELSRVLKARFGHDVHIEGDLVQTDGGGLALTVRGDGVAPKTLNGSLAEFGKLTASAAEYAYAQSEPVLWAYYLNDAGRFEEAIAFSRGAFASANKSDRPYLLNTWGNALLASGRSREGLVQYNNALKLKPDYWPPRNNIIQAYTDLGEEENAWHAGKEMEAAAGGRPGLAPEFDYEEFDRLVWNLTEWRDSIVADADSTGGIGSDTLVAGIQIADAEIRLHNLLAAELAVQTVHADDSDPIAAAVVHFVRGRLAAESGDVSLAVKEMEAFELAFANPNVAANVPGYTCWIALAEEAAGHPDKADAVLKSGGTYVDCYRFRADILGGRGDWAGAQKSYSEAVALAPDLPAAYYSWGLALARRGDLAGAEAKLKEAHLRGPHWADPLKAWGDVLAKQGHRNEALSKYTEALKYAPDWDALKTDSEALKKHSD